MRRRRLVALSLPVLLLAYLAYVVVAFDVAGLAQRARLDNAAILLADSWSHRTHVTRDNRSGEVRVAIDGDRRGTYAPERWPGWVRAGDGATVVDLPDGHSVTFAADGAVTYAQPGESPLTIRVVDGKVTSDLSGPVPDWVSASDTRVAVTTEAGRLAVTRNKAEVMRTLPGWAMFWFTLDSPYHGHLLPEILFGPRIDPERPNLSGAWEDFWGNPLWRHGDVAWALGETMLMAFLGTVGAAALALPLAFLAARNVTPVRALRFGVRRVFDFVRGVDALIWTIALSRAFGPGPLTGTLAIVLTDMGTFGKLFSEAVENMDGRQVEGVASTGASPLLRWRFGAIPQLVPILASQVLYMFESNVRSSTIIGAITGGGIGLLLTQAMQTGKDWEDVTYYVVLILLMVFALDAVSGRVRRRIIRGREV
ncbi:phosphonate ABC transporter, permease protein PhnE [Rubellimicrobium roseum]|uniref:Phosphonate ABC transporter, permease protein PhnE n=1 Tax=Rubellimicrobium roseum TaxID=687525 RepID=A0A5C4N9T2_9RHOB|nr:phosphonate ABC transporter, permease protein PhnE [Rubellimicrobium roseum]TNC71363.1 phosphonate ABC transporter, permease protein PhnE [Rubellimicrobium roseum]